MFVVVVEGTLDLRFWEVLAEFQLGKEPRRVDIVVVRRATKRGVEVPPERAASVLDAMREHMVFHFKGATDELEAVDALQGLAYVAEYMVVAGVQDPAQVGLRVVAPRLTERFTQQVHLLGGTLDATARRGVYEGMLGRFALRVVETSVACDAPREEVLRVLSPRFLTEDMALRPVDERERALYNRMHRCIEQLSRSPEGAMAKDVDLVAKRWERDVAKMLPRMDPKVVLAELTPEQRLAGLAPEQRLAGLAPEQRLAGLAPEQRLAGLAPDEAVRALPLEVLRALPEEYVRTLSLETQAIVRGRRGA
jgi:hypothetical protein